MIRSKLYHIAIIFSYLLLLLSCDRFDPDVEPEKSNAFVKFFGGGFNQQAADIIELDNGNFVIVGTSNAFNESRQNELYFVIADQNGDEIFSRNLGVPENSNANAPQLSAVKALPNGDGFSILVNAVSSNGIVGGFSILNFSPLGGGDNIGQNFIRFDNDALVEANDFEQDSDGNFIVATTVFPDDLNSEGVIFMVDGSSNLLDSVSVFKDGNGDNSFSAITKSEFGDEERFFVIGTSESLLEGEEGITRTRIAEINTNGQLPISEERIDPPEGFDFQNQVGVDLVIIGPNQAAVLARNGDEITGSAFFGTISLNNLQPVGEFRALRSMSGNVLPSRMTRSNDGTLLITGSIQGAGFSGGDIYVDRVDIFGNEINFSSTGTFLNFGGDGLDEGAVTFQGRDGGLVTLGSNSIDGTNSLLMLIKTDINGFFN